MAFDIPTFVVTGAFLMFLCGALLIAASFYYRDAPAAFWWGVSQFLLTVGVLVSLAGGMNDADAETAAAFVLFLTCAAAQWHGTRLLTGNRPYLPLILVGPVAMAAINFLPLGSALPAARGMTAMVLNIAYFAGAIYALVRPQGGKLVAYKPLVILFGVNIIALGLAPFGGLGTNAGGMPPLFSILGALHLESQLFVLASTFFVFAAMRERKEMAQREAAGTDMLTGIANRRSFFDRGERTVGRAPAGTPISVVLFDQDHFKAINDHYGHATGDDVLRVFARVAERLLRPSDILGRIGGEEFAAILHGSTQETAFIIAERIRRAFEANAEFLDGQPIRATLSAGVATATGPIDLDALIKEADAALYMAKDKGRNRVEQSQADTSPPSPSRVPRVA